MKKKILIICPYPQNTVPGQRLKYEQYLNFLSKNEFDIKISPFFSKSTHDILYEKGFFFRKTLGVILGYIKRIFGSFFLPFYDGVYIFLYVVPFSGSILERWYRLLSKKIIYDIDDLVYLLNTSSTNSIASYFRSSGKYFYLMKKSNHVITCTPYLDKIVKQHNSKTTDISSTVDTNLYLPINTYDNKKELVIGWTGSYSSTAYLNSISDILVEITKKFNCKFLAIGSRDFEVNNLAFKKIPWNAKTEVKDLQKIDIGVYPLPGLEWDQGKSGLKAIQFMALGIPVVASAIGANFRVIEHGKSGFLVKSREEWYQYLSQLISDSNLRKNLGLNARKRVENLFSVSSNENKYLKIFKNTFNEK